MLDPMNGLMSEAASQRCLCLFCSASATAMTSQIGLVGLAVMGQVRFVVWLGHWNVRADAVRFPRSRDQHMRPPFHAEFGA